MKTIRSNVFETNSSSTHSISIQKKSNVIFKNPLVENGVLIPQNLRSYFYNNTREDDHLIICDNKDKKAALFCHYALEFFYDDTDKFSDFIIKLKSELNYSDIDINFSSDFNPYCEYDNPEILNDPETFSKSFGEIVNLILDDDVIIIDKTEEY